MIKYYSREAQTLYTGDKTRGLTDQPLYWGSGEGVKFNLARLSELPHVTVNASEKLYESFRHSLKNLAYIAARCAAGDVTGLCADYDAATQRYPDGAALRLLSQFLRQNAHILDWDPALVAQQLLNASDSITQLLQDAHKKRGALTPWLDKASAPSPCRLVNRPRGENPIMMTLPAEPTDPLETKFYRDIATVTIGNRSFIIVLSAVSSAINKAQEGVFFTVWDAKSGAKLLHTRDPDSKQGNVYEVGAVGGYPGGGSAFHILYIELKTFELRCLTVSVGETLMALEGRRIPLALRPEAVKSDDVNASWCASHDQRHLVTNIIDIKRGKSPFDSTPKEPEIPQGNLKLWDLAASLNASKTQVVEPLASISGDAIVTRGLGDAEMPFSALHTPRVVFSPCDRFLVLGIETQEPRTGYKRPHLTLLNANTLAPVWTWHNKDSPFLWVIPAATCSVPGHQGAFLVVFDGGYEKGITSLVITEKKGQNEGQVEGHLGWNSRESTGISSVTPVVAQGAVRIIARPREGPLQMWRIGRKMLKKVPPTTLALAECKKVTQVPGMHAYGDLSMIGRSIAAICTDNALCYSLSNDGEVKVTNMALYDTYAPGDALNDSVSVVRLSADASKLFACAGPILAAFNAETGLQESALTLTEHTSTRDWHIKSILPWGSEEILVKTEWGVEGATGRIPLSAFTERHATYTMEKSSETSSFTLQRLPDAEAKAVKRNAGMTAFMEEQKENKHWSSDLGVSADGRWVCKPPAGESDMRGGQITEERPVYIPEGSAWGVTKQSGASEKQKEKKSTAPEEKGAGGYRSVGGGSMSVGGSGSLGRASKSLGGGVRGSRSGAADDDDDDDAARYTVQLLLTLIDTNTGQSRDVVIHRLREGLFLRLSPSKYSQYRGAFSSNGKLFLAWGNMLAESGGGKTRRAAFEKHFPPMFKLYEMGEGDALKEIAHLEDPYKTVGWGPMAVKRHVKSLHFLPGDTHLVTTSGDGFIRIRGPLPALGVTIEYATQAEGVLDSDLVVTPPDNAALLVTCHADRSVRVWRINVNAQAQSVLPVARFYNASDVHSVCACVKKGTLFVYFGDKSGLVKILNVEL